MCLDVCTVSATSGKKAGLSIGATILLANYSVQVCILSIHRTCALFTLTCGSVNHIGNGDFGNEASLAGLLVVSQGVKPLVGGPLLEVRQHECRHLRKLRLVIFQAQKLGLSANFRCVLCQTGLVSEERFACYGSTAACPTTVADHRGMCRVDIAS